MYVFRDADGRPLYVGKSIDVRKRARSHFTSGAAWTARAEQVDCEETESELGALLLEHRLIRKLKPPANVRSVKEPDGQVFIRCRLDIAFPILEVAREPAAGHAVCIGPVRGRAAAAELVEQLNSLFGLRHCSRKLPRRYHPSAYGQMGRCLSPCLGDLDPNLYRERLERALRLFTEDGGRELLAHVDAEMRAASASAQLRARGDPPTPARAAGLAGVPARRGAADGALRRAAGGRAASRLSPGRGDALLVSGGRVVDWLVLPLAGEEVEERAAAAVRGAPRPGDLGGWLPPDELDEVRLVGGYVARGDVRVLELPARRRHRLGRRSSLADVQTSESGV